MRAAPAPPELRSATGYVMQPVARTMPGDVISPVHNKAVYRHGTGRPSMVGENGHRTTLPTQLRTPRTAVGHVMRPAARAMPGDVMSPVHNQAVCRHDTSDRTTLHDQLRGDVMSLVHTQAVCRHDTGPLDRTACNVMLPVYNKTECRHDTSLAGMVRVNGPRTTLPFILRGLTPPGHRVLGVSDEVIHSLTKTTVDLQRVMLDYRAGRLHRCPGRLVAGNLGFG